MSLRRRITLALALLAFGVVAWLGWSGISAANHARLAWADLQRLQALAEDPSPEILSALQDNLMDLETHLVGAQAASRPFLWLAPKLRWLPQVGPTVGDAPELLAMAVELATGGRMAADALLPLAGLVERHGEGDLLSQLVPALAEAVPQLATADAHLARAEVRRSQVHGPLHPKLAPQLERLDHYLPLGRTALRAVQAAPALLAVEGSRTYLILAQNNHELRPTGGFISGVGSVRLENGRIAGLKLSDSYAVDNFQQPHPDPPAALAEHMGAQLLLLRDSNWSPDFPTSAEVARSLYAQDQGIRTDGAVALDLEAVRLLVEALGPLQLAGSNDSITGDNVMAAMKKAWESPTTSQGTVQNFGSSDWWTKRKDFMGDLVAAALAKLQGGAELDPLGLGRALLAMLDGRHLQIAMDEPALASLFAERKWDGALDTPKRGDFLAVIDTNVGFNKTNAVVREEIDYQVALGADGLVATLTLSYTHTAAPLPADTPCDCTPRYGDSYDELTRRCYWDYLRIYVPGGSTMQGSEGLNRVKTDRGENGATMFSGDFVMRPGEQLVVNLQYRLPAAMSDSPYQLVVRKQAGTLNTPLRVMSEACRWETDLSRDRALVCAP